LLGAGTRRMHIKLFNYLRYLSRKTRQYVKSKLRLRSSTSVIMQSLHTYTAIGCSKSVQLEIACVSKPNSYFH